MITISERLRHQQVEVVLAVADEAADTIDALVEALELARRWVDWDGDRDIINAALAKAKGKQE